jgi:hypothetical protein
MAILTFAFGVFTGIGLTVAAMVTAAVTPPRGRR